MIQKLSGTMQKYCKSVFFMVLFYGMCDKKGAFVSVTRLYTTWKAQGFLHFSSCYIF